MGWLHGGQPNSRCPAHAEANAAQTQRIVQLLRGLTEARAILDGQVQLAFVCYADISEGVLLDAGVFLLPRTHSDASNAARLLHLMLHQRDAPSFDDLARSNSALLCPELVERVMQSEHRAYELEGRLRLAFGLEPTKDRLEELQAAYGKRCIALRSDASSR